MFLYLGVSEYPHVCIPPYICMLPVHLYTPRGVHLPPYAPILFCASVFLEALHVGGCNGLPFVLGHPPYIPCLGVHPLKLHPHTQSLVPCGSVCFRDISMLCGHFPSVEGFGGVSSISWGVGGHQHLRCHMFILVPFL